MDTLPDRLRWILKHYNMGAATLSRKAGLSNAHIGMLIRETIKAPSIDTLNDIADAAKVSRAWLANGIGEPLETDAVDELSPTSGIDERPREKESPSAFGGFASYPRAEASARKIAPEVPDWAWQALRTAHPLWIGKDEPSPAELADIARVIMRHKSG